MAQVGGPWMARKTESKYKKDDILKAKKFKDRNKDVLFIILEEEKEYTLKEVEDLYKEFMTREVK